MKNKNNKYVKNNRDKFCIFPLWFRFLQFNLLSSAYFYFGYITLSHITYNANLLIWSTRGIYAELILKLVTRNFRSQIRKLETGLGNPAPKHNNMAVHSVNSKQRSTLSMLYKKVLDQLTHIHTVVKYITLTIEFTGLRRKIQNFNNKL